LNTGNGLVQRWRSVVPEQKAADLGTALLVPERLALSPCPAGCGASHGFAPILKEMLDDRWVCRLPSSDLAELCRSARIIQQVDQQVVRRVWLLEERYAGLEHSLGITILLEAVQRQPLTDGA
jgi:hypothetical protein